MEKDLTNDEISMIKHLPCPFCGGHSNAIWDDYRLSGRECAVNCAICGARGPYEKTAYHAIERWNKRFQPANQRQAKRST